MAGKSDTGASENKPPKDRTVTVANNAVEDDDPSRTSSSQKLANALESSQPAVVSHNATVSQQAPARGLSQNSATPRTRKQHADAVPSGKKHHDDREKRRKLLSNVRERSHKKSSRLRSGENHRPAKGKAPARRSHSGAGDTRGHRERNSNDAHDARRRSSQSSSEGLGKKASRRQSRDSDGKKSSRRQSRDSDESIEAFHTVHDRHREVFKHGAHKKGDKKEHKKDDKKEKKTHRAKPVQVDTKKKPNQAFYNMMLGAGAVIIMIMFYRATRGSQSVPGNSAKQEEPVEKKESLEAGAQEADVITGSLVSEHHRKSGDAVDFMSRPLIRDPPFVPDAPAKGGHGIGLEDLTDSWNGAELGLEARPETGEISALDSSANEGRIVEASPVIAKIKPKTSEKTKASGSSERTIETDHGQNDDLDVAVVDCEPAAKDERSVKEPEETPSEASGPPPETRVDALSELKKLKAKEDARHKLEEERNQAIAKMAKLEEDQAKVLEQEAVAEKAFKRFPYKARKAAVSKIGDSHWDNSSWRARVAAAQAAMEEDDSPEKEEKAKAPRKKGGRAEKRAKES